MARKFLERTGMSDEEIVFGCGGLAIMLLAFGMCSGVIAILFAIAWNLVSK